MFIESVAMSMTVTINTAALVHSARITNRRRSNRSALMPLGSENSSAGKVAANATNPSACASVRFELKVSTNNGSAARVMCEPVLVAAAAVQRRQYALDNRAFWGGAATSVDGSMGMTLVTGWGRAEQRLQRWG